MMPGVIKGEMKRVRQLSADDEPEWDCFSTRATDFRPHWGGDFVNVFTTIRPKEDADRTRKYAIECTRMLASWIINNRREFGARDRFQIIVGWPKDVRSSGRQMIKTGGDFSDLERIASGIAEVKMTGNWTAAVFEQDNR